MCQLRPLIPTLLGLYLINAHRQYHTYSVIFNGQIGTSLYQQFNDVSVSVPGGINQRSLSFAVRSTWYVINAGAIVYEDSGYLEKTMVASLMQGSPPTVVPCVDLCTLLTMVILNISHNTFCIDHHTFLM